MQIVDALVDALEAQEQRIEALEKKLSSLNGAMKKGYKPTEKFRQTVDASGNP